MEDDLTWLARTEHRWPKDAVYVSRHENAVEWHYVELSFIGYGYFTRDQWLARRAELQNKPSFADHPDAKCFVQQDDGIWFKSVGKVQLITPSMSGGWVGDGSGTVRWVELSKGEVLGDWRDTLERRPADRSEPAVTERLTEAAQTVLAAAPALMDEKFRFDRDDWYERGELPPVGVECEIFGKDASPEKCKIIAYHKDQVAVQWESFGGGILDVLYLRGDYWKFRPIRTERQLTVDEMMAVAAANFGNLETCCEALYDAGYRKQISPAK